MERTFFAFIGGLGWQKKKKKKKEKKSYLYEIDLPSLHLALLGGMRERSVCNYRNNSKIPSLSWHSCFIKDTVVVNRVFTYVIKPHIAYRIWLLSDRKEIGIESAKSKET